MRQAIAHVIMNRVGHREWKHLTTPAAVVMHSGFDAFTQKDPPYQSAFYYLSHRPIVALNPYFETLILHCHPILRGEIPDDTGSAVLYFSPRAQAQLHHLHPEVYRADIPAWNFGILEETKPPGILPTDDFKWFKYKV